MKKILIVEDHLLITKALKERLKDSYQVFEAYTGEEAIEIQKEEKPEIVVLDLCLPEISGFELIDEFKKNDPDITIIILTAMEDACLIKSITLTVDSVLFKSKESPDDIAQKISELSENRKTDTRSYITKLISIKDGLTRAELKIYPLMTRGQSSLVIAEKIYRSVNTVNNYRKSILKKLNLKKAYVIEH